MSRFAVRVIAAVIVLAAVATAPFVYRAAGRTRPGRRPG
jgi:hypothetical protein